MTQKKTLNGYELSSRWFDFCFENPEKIRPLHSAIYFFAIEHWNRLGMKDKFGLPTSMVMEAIGIKKWHSYKKALNDLIDWGFIKEIQKSKNQYSSTIISIINKCAYDKKDKALDKALSKHGAKHCQSTRRSKVDIIEHENNRTIEQGNMVENDSESCQKQTEEIYQAYPRKVGKGNAIKAIEKALRKIDCETLLAIVKRYADKISWQDKQFIPHPATWFNGERWKDDPKEWEAPASNQFIPPQDSRDAVLARKSAQWDLENIGGLKSE